MSKTHPEQLKDLITILKEEKPNPEYPIANYLFPLSQHRVHSLLFHLAFYNTEVANQAARIVLELWEAARRQETSATTETCS